ncbi:MAG: putative 2-aminoethylphosphonate ABC transporter permease subunit [Alphaproteobacteria bacterium]
MAAGLGLVALLLIVFVGLPLYTLLSKSFENPDGGFVGLANFSKFLTTPALSISISNSLQIALAASFITTSLAFVYAYAITRSQMPLRPLFKGLALLPLLAPSLLPGISLVYLFGNKGLVKEWLMGESIYGPIGIVMGEVFYTFPHAVMILVTALSITDGRLYEAAEVLGAGTVRKFFTVTVPAVRYGLVSAFFVVFTLVVTDFGIPKVIGGNYNVLATDVYKQVVGRNDFQMGAVVGMILLLPALLAFAVDRLVQRKQVALLSARAVPYTAKASPGFDRAMTAFCTVIALMILSIFAMAALASFVKLWPYNLEFVWKHYDFDLTDGGSWTSFWNSIEMAALTAIFGTAVVFGGAYLVEKQTGFKRLRSGVQLLCMIPMAVPGLVLGVAYIFFFVDQANPLHFLYHSMAILVVNTVAHFYTVAHLTAVTALKQMDGEFEAVSASLQVPVWRTFRRVTVPLAMPAILDISLYLFVNAMTTVSAVVFLYSPNTTLASVAVLNMDDAGDVAPAAAMAMMIVYTCIVVRLAHAALSRAVLVRTQAWRRH